MSAQQQQQQQQRHRAERELDQRAANKRDGAGWTVRRTLAPFDAAGPVCQFVGHRSGLVEEAIKWRVVEQHHEAEEASERATSGEHKEANLDTRATQRHARASSKAQRTRVEEQRERAYGRGEEDEEDERASAGGSRECARESDDRRCCWWSLRERERRRGGERRGARDNEIDQKAKSMRWERRQRLELELELGRDLNHR